MYTSLNNVKSVYGINTLPKYMKNEIMANLKHDDATRKRNFHWHSFNKISKIYIVNKNEELIITTINTYHTDVFFRY